MPIRRAASLSVLVSLGLSTVAPAFASAASAPGLIGFDGDRAVTQRELEGRFDAALSPPEMKTWLERLAARPHHVGSAWGKANAEWMRDQFAAWGFEARLEEFQVLFPTPKIRRLEMTAPTRFQASLVEPSLAEDKTSGQREEQLPTYNAYSVDGDVEGELVYVNQGLPKDYDELALRGIDVKGKIVIARYGGSWRGIKPKVAAERGAIGCIIYSDPGGDGWTLGDMYPKGGWRSDRSVQRGSVADMPHFAGDPLTPGVAATAGAQRLEISAAPTLTKIPVLPISAADARPLLAALGGPMAPESFRGALPQPYRLGPGPARVRLTLAFDWSLKPIYDVVAVMAGAEFPEQWVVRGNHHDAWVNGANDPVSGMVALLAEAKAVGTLAKAGFKPRRTLVYAGWDGEEPGLLGSTEWVEAHLGELRGRAVAYVNTDSTSRGTFGAAGSHALEPLVSEVAREVKDPAVDATVFARARAVELEGSKLAESAKIRGRKDLEIGALGSGSDFTPFLQHAGVASLNIGFGGEEQYGQYHSIYDSIDHYQRFDDGEHLYGAALAKVAGRIVLRLSEADRLPFEVESLAKAIRGYVDEVKDLADQSRKETEEKNARLDDRSAALAADPRLTYVAPAKKDIVPYLNFAPLDNAAARLERAAEGFAKAVALVPLAGEDARLVTINETLRAVEPSLTPESGLPGRPWYRHQIYAPGQYTGYGVKTLPAIREAIELRRWSEAEAQTVTVAKVLDGLSQRLEDATAALAGRPE
jgi:N-acetylated-alpha-linked acidic dipeptidase